MFKYITFLTGAGVSTDSGVPDFKSTDLNWKYELPREEILSKSYFQNFPNEFWEIYKDIFQIKLLNKYRPNYAHIFLKELEDKGKKIKILTQNVDNLHQTAGSTNVYELHGNVKNAICPKCRKIYDIKYIINTDIPICNCNENNNILKPNIVLYDEIPNHTIITKEIIDQTELLIVLGSALEISTIAKIIMNAKKKKIKLCIINKEPTIMDYEFDIIINDNISKVFKKINKYCK